MKGVQSKEPAIDLVRRASSFTIFGKFGMSNVDVFWCCPRAVHSSQMCVEEHRRYPVGEQVGLRSILRLKLWKVAFM